MNVSTNFHRNPSNSGTSQSGPMQWTKKQMDTAILRGMPWAKKSAYATEEEKVNDKV